MSISGSVDRSPVSAISAELRHRTDVAHDTWRNTRGRAPSEAVDAAWREYSRAYDARVQFDRAVAVTKEVLDSAA